ncbi:HAMP domain-containing sensor histidine kinase [Methylobacter sp. Wu8]|uniref:histidine kinase n=1 Tax=Methylobacter tundripaludum TaxID=173365 RepID=A0A2S6H4J7_9GAMM|nr:HAMP domain-containing sensor histidine kinase [Methylobacter tundripaludum]MCF7965661.1 HAMP domain-containing histidine kinase [Methylobacter tundripaludum]MCK9635929.1 HAMP domain-containing histidine kinase [Methylobacter tundripaludum]MDD2661725.1 HAMP domain-containing sensor histidine kinase [Methylococcales bacterium]PPK72367.1 signal transduction histidine kinase [Methylobacter tundripaludum]
MSNTHMLSIGFPAILASSVHDIKNSLTALRALVGQLENIYQDPKPTEFRQLEFETNRMNNSLMQLLTLYKIDLSQFSLSVDEHSAADILEDIVAQQSTLLSLGNVQLITECHGDLFCYCDSAMISNALCTLVNNAQRYCKSKVLISASEEDDYIVFCIEDDGKGYPENLMSPDYKQLHQVDLATGNTGLGLFFTETIAQLHVKDDKHGFIVTDNNSQFGGARFKLYLP